jgi:deazaflavin-dependent oxidoreductase (nitroreductase family)
VKYTPGAILAAPYLKLHDVVYRATNGAIGKRGVGAPTLLLTTTGRKTGTARTHSLVYAKDGDDYVVVASKGGSDQPPAWLLNLQANPDVHVQDGRRGLDATASVATGDERARLWVLVNRNNRGLAPLLHRGAIGRYDVYQRNTTREIAVVVLTPVRR